MSAGLCGITEVTGPYSPPVDKQSDQYIRIIRITLKRDRSLSDNKYKIYNFVLNFEKNRSWTGHVYMDVDPV